MKITHKINHGWAPNRNDPEWEKRVEREAEATTNRTQKAWERAQRRLARVEAKLARARESTQIKPGVVRGLAAEVERRRLELTAIESLMVASPAGSVHRGRGSHRGVPGTSVR